MTYIIGDYVRTVRATEELNTTIVGRVSRVVGIGHFGQTPQVYHTQLAGDREDWTVPLYDREVTPATEAEFLVDRLTQ